MTPNDVKEFFKTGYVFEKKTKMSHNTMFNWIKKGFVPVPAQCVLEKITNGQLKADLHNEYTQAY